jgi:hypothetical protein
MIHHIITPHERRVLPGVVSKQRLVLAGEGGDEGYAPSSLYSYLFLQQSGPRSEAPSPRSMG